MRRFLYLIILGCMAGVQALYAQPNYDYSRIRMEKLGRGVVAMRNTPYEVIVSWRYLSSDPQNVTFNVYRNGERVNKIPVANCTFFRDRTTDTTEAVYEVRPILPKVTAGISGSSRLPANAPNGYLEIPLRRPEGGVTPDGQAYEYTPNDASVGDVDGDGCDEIVYGSCTIDHNGEGLYSTGMGHGDALHLTCFDLERNGMQVWDCHENKRDGSTFRDAATGEVLMQIKSPVDVGRCMAADIDPESPGVEMWSSASRGLWSARGELLCRRSRRLPVNMAVWWDGDLLREMLDHVTISKYDWKEQECVPLLRFEGCRANNGTKGNPCLQGDIIGDWREEVLVRTEDNTALRLYVSPESTPFRFHTFLEDPVYRISIATQNVGYNQPTQPGFYFGPDLKGLFRGTVIP